MMKVCEFQIMTIWQSFYFALEFPRAAPPDTLPTPNLSLTARWLQQLLHEASQGQPPSTCFVSLFPTSKSFLPSLSFFSFSLGYQSLIFVQLATSPLSTSTLKSNVLSIVEKSRLSPASAPYSLCSPLQPQSLLGPHYSSAATIFSASKPIPSSFTWRTSNHPSKPSSVLTPVMMCTTRSM